METIRETLERLTPEAKGIYTYRYEFMLYGDRNLFWSSWDTAATVKECLPMVVEMLKDQIREENAKQVYLYKIVVNDKGYFKGLCIWDYLVGEAV